MVANELIYGNYYRYIENDVSYIFRFEKIKNNIIYCSGYYNFLEKRFIESYKRFTMSSSKDSYQKIFIDEMVKYLPINHIDLIYYYRMKKIESLLKI